MLSLSSLCALLESRCLSDGEGKDGAAALMAAPHRTAGAHSSDSPTQLACFTIKSSDIGVVQAWTLLVVPIPASVPQCVPCARSMGCFAGLLGRKIKIRSMFLALLLEGSPVGGSQWELGAALAAWWQLRSTALLSVCSGWFLKSCIASPCGS